MLLEIILTVATFAADSADADPVRESAEYRACRAAGSEVFGQIVQTPWTSVTTLDGEVEVVACIMRGEPDARPAFLRDADRIVFALVGHGDREVNPTVRFSVRMDSGRTLDLGPAWIRVKPDGALTCRIDICEAFGEPGERVKEIRVETHPPASGPVRNGRH